MAQPRINYDAIAHLYDSQPYRAKTVDAHLLAYIKAHPERAARGLAVLDVSCGTGNQLVANRGARPDLHLVGLDRFRNMLLQAQRKTRDIGWVQADAAAPPFPDAAFDFITHQFAFHHVQDKVATLHAIHRMLKPGGRFVLSNICPSEMPDSLLYRYFPAAWALDMQDFMPRRDLIRYIQGLGFHNTHLTLDYRAHEQDLQGFLDTTLRRDTASQLIAISDQDYEQGLRRIQADLAQIKARPAVVSTETCLLTLIGDK